MEAARPAAGFDAGEEAAAEPETRSIRDAVADLAEAGARGAAKKRNATEQDWADFLSVLAGFASMVLIWWLVLGKGWTKQQRVEFEFTDDEADAIATPAARILARSWVNDRWGKNILGASDYILLALVAWDYTDRISPLIRDRVGDVRLRRPGRRQQSRAEATPPPAPHRNNPTPEERDEQLAQPAEPEPQHWPIYPANLT